MRRRILAITASLAVAVGAAAPAAHAQYRVPREQPPSCDTLIGNVVYGDYACEDTELEP
jgi:hypothetical protein